MKKSIIFVAFSLVVFAPLAGAHEYPLQFTPNAGYRNLVVAGYRFELNAAGAPTDIVGNCSYQTVSGVSGGGKGGGGRAPKTRNYQQTCRWGLYGNLLSITPGAPAVPTPRYVQGTVTVYDVSPNGDYTGSDTSLQPGHGFVNAPGSHYKWLTPSSLGVLHQVAYTLTATLKSDGDMPVNITAVTPSALHGAVVLKSTTCTSGPINVGDTCSITLTYDPSGLTSPIGLAYDTLRIDLTSDAGEAHDFIQNYVIVLPQKL